MSSIILPRTFALISMLVNEELELEDEATLIILPTVILAVIVYDILNIIFMPLILIFKLFKFIKVHRNKNIDSTYQK